MTGFLSVWSSEKGAAVKLQRTEDEADTPWCLIRAISVDTPAGGFPAMSATPVRKQLHIFDLLASD